MNLNTHIKGIRHIADSFCFSDSAGIADIRLDYLNGIIHEIPYVFPSAEHPLPMGQRHFHIILYIFVIVEYRRVRLLKIVNITVLDCCRQLDCRIGIGSRVIFNNKVNLGAYGLPDSMDTVGENLYKLRRKQAQTVGLIQYIALFIPVKEINLNGIVTILKGKPGPVHIILYGYGRGIYWPPSKLQL